MKNHPEAAELLRIARETLLTELRPVVPEHARYALAMVANAMAIAAREIEAGEAGAVDALARLDSLAGEPHRELSGDALRAALADRERALCRDIRAGGFDGDDARRRALLAHLRQSVEAKLAISNPKALSVKT